jgi:general secretion pathway protein G
MSNARSGNLVAIVGIALVLGVMVFLMELLTRRMDTRLKASPRSLAELQLRQLHYAVEAFRVDVGRTPQQAEGLEALLRSPPGAQERWKGPYLQKSELPSDPWDRPYSYQAAPEGRFDVVSLGSDGSPGGQADAEDLYSSKIVATPTR